MNKKDVFEKERRGYLRLDSVFPVQFRLLSEDKENYLSDWQVGFTNNVGKGGICLTAIHLPANLAAQIQAKSVKLAVDIEMPVSRHPTPALASVAWVQEESEACRYLIGLRYDEIERSQNNKIMRFAWARKLFAPVVLTLMIIFGLGFGANSFVNYTLTKDNKALVNQLVQVTQEYNIARQKIQDISFQREEFQMKIQALENSIQSASEDQKRIEPLAKEKSALQERLIVVQRDEQSVNEELSRLNERKASLEKANLDKMYQWLKVHQNRSTGLVLSFEGDNDISGWGFSYDQALACIIYSYFSDFEQAKKILDFYLNKAERVDGRFLNAYYVEDGTPAEFIVHSGPNIWLGIAILHYTTLSYDIAYLPLAQDIADAVVHIQGQDSDGGIRGGPNVEWYATEHNLDAYAFFNMMSRVTGNQKYAVARDRILQWLLAHTYDKSEVPIQRGKGDSTIATDTYAWTIAAIGPEKLESIDMDPDKILEFAEQHCCIETIYERPGGAQVTVKGFDFAPQRHVGRGGVVSSEWTAQMILSFKIMADYYDAKGMAAKARFYALKADSYLAELGSMVISSPSPSGQGESCLPYATQENVDTGHGWMTPKGNSTGSVAGTAYTLFAYYKYNPLELKD